MKKTVPQLDTTDGQRAELERLVRTPTTEQRIAQRARIVLDLARGESLSETARRHGAARLTVRKWSGRFRELGAAGLADAPRSGQPRKLSDDSIRAIVRATQEEAPPKGRTHWSCATMAKRFKTNATAIQRVWRAHNLKPHLTKTFKMSKDPKLAEKVRDVVGLYMDPPERAIVLCVDEKSQIQALNRTQPVLPLRPGKVERHTHDYERNGTATLFAAPGVATGKVIGSVGPRHRASEFLAFLKKIDTRTGRGLDLHLVVDNYSTHKTPAVKAWLDAHPRFHLHFTPTGGSWLNMVETWFSALTRRRLRRGVFRSLKELVDALHEYIRENNKAPRPFVWTKPAAKILAHSHMVTD